MTLVREDATWGLGERETLSHILNELFNNQFQTTLSILNSSCPRAHSPSSKFIKGEAIASAQRKITLLSCEYSILPMCSLSRHFQTICFIITNLIKIVSYKLINQGRTERLLFSFGRLFWLGTNWLFKKRKICRVLQSPSAH